MNKRRAIINGAQCHSKSMYDHMPQWKFEVARQGRCIYTFGSFLSSTVIPRWPELFCAELMMLGEAIFTARNAAVVKIRTIVDLCNISMRRSVMVSCDKMMQELPTTKKEALSLLPYICGGNHIESAMLVSAKFKISLEEVMNVTFESCCLWGSLDCLQWFVGMTKSPPRCSVLLGFSKCCANGNFAMAKWLTNRFSIDGTEARFMLDRALAECCGAGRTEMVEWLIKQFKIQKEIVCDGGLKKAVVNDCRDVVLLLKKTYSLKREDVTSAFYKCCILGTLPSVQWMYKEFGFVDKGIAIMALPICCQHGKFGTVKWLTATFSLTKQDICANNICIPFHSCCASGNIKIAIWLKKKFCLLPTNINTRCAFGAACSGGYIFVAQWLVNACGATIDDAIANDNAIIKECCEKNYVELVTWIVDRFGLTGKNIYPHQRSILRTCCMFNWLEMAKILVDKLGVASQDVQMCIIPNNNEQNDTTKWLVETFKNTNTLEPIQWVKDIS
jgi:hypothetical protein